MMGDWWFWIGGLVHLDWLMVDRCIWIGSSGFGCYVWGFVGDFFLKWVCWDLWGFGLI